MSDRLREALEAVSARPMSPASTTVTNDGLVQSGMNLGGLRQPSDGSLADLGNYFGGRSIAEGGTDIEDLKVMGVDPAEALAVARGAVREVEFVNGAEVSNVIDAANQRFDQPGLSPQMSRDAMFAVLDSNGGPRAALAARDRALGITHDPKDLGKKFANVNGQMIELTPEMYNSIVNRDATAIAQTISQATPMQDVPATNPGGNAATGATAASPATVQQPEFKQTPLPEVWPEISQKASDTMQAKAMASTAKIATRYGDPGITPLMVEDWERGTQMPINNVENYFV